MLEYLCISYESFVYIRNRTKKENGAVNMFQIISPKELESIQKNSREKSILLDLRPRENFLQSHIRHAVSYPFESIENGTYCLPKDYQIILYCERGGMSMAAARILGDRGFYVKTVMGGIRAVKKEMLESLTS